VPSARAIAVDEYTQVIEPERAALQGVVDIGAVVLIPDGKGCLLQLGSREGSPRRPWKKEIMMFQLSTGFHNRDCDPEYV
jgi:hypothetical protein